ncbi:putative sigma-factor [Bacillus phage vB_BcM_Sam46]|uniref:Putative sigma-factor n=2 Tax=Caudoviricetes TaxID=2731619 RepID=A0A6G9L6T3_9CAUD|nr:putative sigma-factor [Bacillus phage vB_BcM_Sam112]QIQ61275.1 putative sigma-factor [Bacillus phage vB_BcM_Sam46]
MSFKGCDNISMQNIWEQVKENDAKLRKCQQHDFSIDLEPGSTWNKKWKCTKCGGHVQNQAKYWYEMGVTHEKARKAYE